MARDPRNQGQFEIEVLGPINGLNEFTGSPAIRRIVGQTSNTLDFGRALNQSALIIANMQSGDHADDDHRQTLGRLLLRAILYHAKRRSSDWTPVEPTPLIGSNIRSPFLEPSLNKCSRARTGFFVGCFGSFTRSCPMQTGASMKLCISLCLPKF